MLLHRYQTRPQQVLYYTKKHRLKSRFQARKLYIFQHFLESMFPHYTFYIGSSQLQNIDLVGRERGLRRSLRSSTPQDIVCMLSLWQENSILDYNCYTW
jgi:hypothetical protein